MRRVYNEVHGIHLKTEMLNRVGLSDMLHPDQPVKKDVYTVADQAVSPRPR
jgi:hypothetical protein